MRSKWFKCTEQGPLASLFALEIGLPPGHQDFRPRGPSPRTHSISLLKDVGVQDSALCGTCFVKVPFSTSTEVEISCFSDYNALFFGKIFSTACLPEKKRDVRITDAVVRGNVITTKYNRAATLRIKILELEVRCYFLKCETVLFFWLLPIIIMMPRGKNGSLLSYKFLKGYLTTWYRYKSNEIEVYQNSI